MADRTETIRFIVNPDGVVTGMRTVNREMDKGQKEVKDTTKDFGALGKQMDGLKGPADSLRQGLTLVRGALGALGVALSLSAFKGFTTDALNAANQLSDTALKLGLTAEALQELRFAAGQFGISAGALDVGIQRFTRRVGEAAEGTGVLFKALQENRVAIRDANGELRDAVDVLDDYADVIKNAKSPADQLLLAFKAFDTEGAGLVTLLKGGSEALAAFREEARALGAVMDEDLVQEAAAANTRIKALSDVLTTAFRSTLLDAFLEDFGSFEDALVRIIPLAQQFGTIVGNAMGLLADAFALAVENLELLLAGLGAAAGFLVGGGPFGAAIGAVAGYTLALALASEETRGLEQATKDLEIVQAELAAVAKGTIFEADLIEQETKLLLEIGKLQPGLEAASFAFDQLNESADTTNGALGQTEEEAAAAAAAIAKLRQETETAANNYESLRASLDPVFAAMVQHEDQVEILNEAIRRGVITNEEAAETNALLAESYAEALKAAEEFGKETEKTTEKLEEQKNILEAPLLNAIEGIQDSFVDAFKGILDGGVKSFKDLGDTIFEIMKQTAAEIAALLVFQPIVENVFAGFPQGQGGLSSFFGTGSSAAGNFFNRQVFPTGGGPPGTAGPAALGTGSETTFGQAAGGGLAGLGVGSFIGSNTGLNQTGAAIGGLVGGIAGSFIPVPIVGTLIGAALGSVLGGAIGNLFTSGKNDQRIQVATLPGGTPSGLLDEKGREFFQGGFSRDTPFGTIGLVNAETKSLPGEFEAEVLNLIEEFDNAAASVLSIRQTKLVAQILQDAETGELQRGTSIGEGDIGKVLKDRILTITEGLIGRPLAGVREELEQLPVKDVEAILEEGNRFIEIIGLFADGFERGLRALTGGFNAVEAQVFSLEEAANDTANQLLETIEGVRDAVQLLRPDIPQQEDFFNIKETVVTTKTGQGDAAVFTTEVIREVIPDIEAYNEALAAQGLEIRKFNEQVEQSEEALKEMVLGILGLGEASDIEPLRGAALVLKQMRIEFKALQPVLEELGFSASEAAALIDEGLVKTTEKLRDDFNEALDAEILGLKNPRRAAIQQLNEERRNALADARQFGGDIEKVNELFGLKRVELEKRFAKERNDVLEGANDNARQNIGALRGFLQSLRTGDLSPLNERKQLQLAEQGFERAERQFAAGKITAQEFIGAGNLFLQEGRDVFASGQGFSDIFRQVTKATKGLIGENLELIEAQKTNEAIVTEAKANRQNRDANTEKIVGTLVKELRDLRRTWETGAVEGRRTRQGNFR